MFTGLIDHCGEITQITPLAHGLRLTIHTQFTNVLIGESIAVDGICLTVVTFKAPFFVCEIAPETLQITNCSDWQVGQLVNLERALQVGQRLGGHWVQGHVDQTLQVHSIMPIGIGHQINVTGTNAQNQLYLVPKGSITLNGISLTVNTVSADGCSVMIVPHTWQVTTISRWKVGERLNVEFDAMAKWVMRAVQKYQHLMPANLMQEKIHE